MSTTEPVRIRAVTVCREGSQDHKWHISIFEALLDGFPDEDGVLRGGEYRWERKTIPSSQFRPRNSISPVPPAPLVKRARRLAKKLQLRYIKGLQMHGKEGLSPLELLAEMNKCTG